MKKSCGWEDLKADIQEKLWRPDESGTSLKAWKKKTKQNKTKQKPWKPRILHPVKTASKIGSEVKKFSNKTKIREFVASRPAL